MIAAVVADNHGSDASSESSESSGSNDDDDDDDLVSDNISISDGNDDSDLEIDFEEDSILSPRPMTNMTPVPKVRPSAPSGHPITDHESLQPYTPQHAHECVTKGQFAYLPSHDADNRKQSIDVDI